MASFSWKYRLGQFQVAIDELLRLFKLVLARENENLKIMVLTEACRNLVMLV